MSTTVWAAILALACAGVTHGQEEAEKPSRPVGSLVPLKVQVVFTRMLGEKKISSVPYILSVGAGDVPPSMMRMGVKVPVTARSSADDNTPAAVTYEDVSTNLDCVAQILDENRYRLILTLEQSSLASGDKEAVNGTPVLRTPVFQTFRARTTLVLRDGQTSRNIVATDPASGEVLQVDVTLNVVK